MKEKHTSKYTLGRHYLHPTAGGTAMTLADVSRVMT